MLEIRDLSVCYGDVRVLDGVSLSISSGEIVALVGANAAGKTTLVNTISGLLRCRGGSISFCGTEIGRLKPWEIVALGIVQVPEGRKLFPRMTVLENLQLGAFTPEARKNRKDNLKKVFDLLPILEERQNQIAGSLSGGEQQMLAIGRGLMAQPKVLMLDEPSLGLAPLMVRRILEIVRLIRDMGTSVLLIEQNVKQSLTIAQRGYVLENGRIVMGGTAEELLADEHLKRAYLGL